MVLEIKIRKIVNLDEKECVNIHSHISNEDGIVRKEQFASTMEMGLYELLQSKIEKVAKDFFADQEAYEQEVLQRLLAKKERICSPQNQNCTEQ